MNDDIDDFDGYEDHDDYEEDDEDDGQAQFLTMEPDPEPNHFQELEVEHPYSALTPDVVIDAVETTGLISDARIFPLNSYENRVYQVGVEEGEPIIVKFYRPNRWSDEQIIEEHKYTQELEDLEVPVVPPVAIDGRTLFEFKQFRFAIYKRKGGHAPELDNMDNLLILGRFIGRIHAVGAVKDFTSRPILTIDSFAKESRDYLLKHNFLPRDLAIAYSTLADDLIEKCQQRFHDVGALSQIRLHGDCHIGNVLWRDNAPHFVDFDDARTGPAIQDLWMLLSGDRPSRTAQLAEIIDGYNEFHEFNPIELHLIEPLRTLRIMHYSAWLARRWTDPAFPHNFPWFNTERYWAEHILELREQLSAMDEEPLKLF